jgi:hypothetical protein
MGRPNDKRAGIAAKGQSSRPPSTAFDISLFAASLYALCIAQAGSLIRQALNRNIRTFRRDSRRVRNHPSRAFNNSVLNLPSALFGYLP